MNRTKLKGRLDRIGKTTLEHFQDIKELEVADGPEIKVEDIVPYKCEKVEKSLKALEIIKEKNVDVFRFKKLDFNIFNQLQKSCKLLELTEEEFNLLKKVLK